MSYFLAVCIQAMVGVLWAAPLFDEEQEQVEVLKHTEQTCTSCVIIYVNICAIMNCSYKKSFALSYMLVENCEQNYCH